MGLGWIETEQFTYLVIYFIFLRNYILFIYKNKGYKIREYIIYCSIHIDYMCVCMCISSNIYHHFMENLQTILLYF